MIDTHEMGSQDRRVVAGCGSLPSASLKSPITSAQPEESLRRQNFNKSFFFITKKEEARLDKNRDGEVDMRNNEYMIEYR